MTDGTEGHTATGPEVLDVRLTATDPLPSPTTRKVREVIRNSARGTTGVRVPVSQCPQGHFRRHSYRKPPTLPEAQIVRGFRSRWVLWTEGREGTPGVDIGGSSQ